MDKKPLRTIVYVDGFNLYYGQLKGTSYKWLDPVALFQRVLGPQNQITQIKYFTARVQPTVNEPSVNTRQDAYFRALGLWCPLVRNTALQASQLPSPVPGSTLTKPATW